MTKVYFVFDSILGAFQWHQFAYFLHVFLYIYIFFFAFNKQIK